MSRKYCSKCLYPLKTCLCHAIQKVAVPLSVVAIQHHKEKAHAKNTLRLAKLISPEINIIDSRDDLTIKKVVSDSSLTSVLLYPNLLSKPLEEHATLKTNKANTIQRVIFIDGTWKQAHAIWKKYKMEEYLASFHFTSSLSQAYRIRSSKRGFQLSTLEAIAHSLSIICKLDTSPYYNILDAMQQHWPLVQDTSQTPSN